MKTAFFALNRHNEFPTWEECQMVFHVGIAMPDGERATGIGRCQDMHDFARRLSQWTFLESPARREFLIDHFQKRGWLNCSHKSQVRLECEYEAYRRGTLRAVKLSALTT
jgi:hypothetical protein